MTLTRRDAGLLVLLTLMWGVNWPMMKFSLREVTPLWFRALTMSGGALMLMLFYLARGSAMRLPRSEWARVAWLALPNIVGWHFFSILGLKELASGRAAILGFTMPVWTVLIGLLLAHDRMTPRVWISVAGAAAAVALLSAQELAQLAGRPLGIVWMQLAAVSWALGTLLVRRSSTALPVEALKARGIPIHGIAFTGEDNPDNIKTIAAFSGVKVLGRLPRLENLNAATLRSAFAGNFSAGDFG